jgi:hypothetical protein
VSDAGGQGAAGSANRYSPRSVSGPWVTELVDGQPTGRLRHRSAKRWYGVWVRIDDQIHDMRFAEDGTLLADMLR